MLTTLQKEPVLDRSADTAVTLFDSWLRVTFSQEPGDHADYHYVWLRHNCDHDRHPATGERIRCSSALPHRPRPLSASIQGDTLHIAWDEPGRPGPSVYSLSWLREHAYAHRRVAVAPPSGDVTSVSLTASGQPEEDVSRALALVNQHGIAVVRNFGQDTELLVNAFAATGLQVRPSHFGYIEDLRTDNTTNQNTDQLGYTDYPVDLHTDLPFLEQPPQFQLLQCMQPASVGGENYFVDGLQALAYLRSIDEHAHALLSQTPIRFHRKQRVFERLQISPLLSNDPVLGPVLRYSYFTMAPHRTAFDEMEAWYRAYNLFAEVVNTPAHQYHASLAAGDFVLYNNYRMLHARRGFTGNRWMRGIYFNATGDRKADE